MAKAALNKSALNKEREQLRLYQRVLPSLDLKRRQLTLEAAQARLRLVETQTALEQVRTRLAEQVPMLANAEIALAGIVQITAVQLREENHVGVKLPVLVEVQCQVHPYAWLAKPHWVDVVVKSLQQAATLHMQVQVAHERLQRLERAVRRATQRVNLFDKVLIPTAQQNIRRIQIALGDAERAAIVRSKIAKARH